jgi:hypothetical protein
LIEFAFTRLIYLESLLWMSGQEILAAEFNILQSGRVVINCAMQQVSICLKTRRLQKIKCCASFEEHKDPKAAEIFETIGVWLGIHK